MILEGVVVYCETWNSDGIDARKDNAVVLKALGAEVVDAFSDTITHLVWSNGSTKKLTAASLFDITVVSPSWILECEQSGVRAPEAEYSVPLWPCLSPPVSSPIDQKRNSPRLSWPSYISSKGALNMGDGSDKIKKEIIAQHLSEIPLIKSGYNSKESSEKCLDYKDVYANDVYAHDIEGRNGDHLAVIMDKRMQIILSDIEDWPPALKIKIENNHESGTRLTIIALTIISVLFTVVLVMAICFYVILFRE